MDEVLIYHTVPGLPVDQETKTLDGRLRRRSPLRRMWRAGNERNKFSPARFRLIGVIFGDHVQFPNDEDMKPSGSLGRKPKRIRGVSCEDPVQFPNDEYVKPSGAPGRKPKRISGVSCEDHVQFPNDEYVKPSGAPGRKPKRISGVYASDPNNKRDQVFKIEHSALQLPETQWEVEVKYRTREIDAAKTGWSNVRDFYPGATVKMKHNFLELTVPSPKEDHEFAAFGIPAANDKKRMQMGVFGGKPTQGTDWCIYVTLFDDTMMAYKNVCQKEESKGRQLLTTLAGLCVSNSHEDIKIYMRALEKGFQVKGSNVKTIKSKDAWNSPENSTDFPCCTFELAHVDEMKQSFFCGVTVTHLNDTADTEVVTFFGEVSSEEKKEVNHAEQTLNNWKGLTIREDNVIEVFMFLQMLVFLVGCFTGVGFDPHPQPAGSVASQLENYNLK